MRHPPSLRSRRIRSLTAPPIRGDAAWTLAAVREPDPLADGVVGEFGGGDDRVKMTKTAMATAHEAMASDDFSD